MNPIFVVVVVVLAVFAAATSFYRLRKGDPGPNTGWFPRSARGKVNEEYEKKGWEKPYDDNGDRATGRKLF